MRILLMQGRLKPGRMLLVDTVAKSITRDEDLKQQISSRRPVQQWLDDQVLYC